MPGNKVKIGPWPSGMNLQLNEDLIGDDHLRDVLNFDVDNDGTLLPRRGLRFYAFPGGAGTTAKLLGSVNIDSGTTTNVYAVQQMGTGIYYTNTVNSVWSTAAYTMSAAMNVVVPYNGVLYYVPASGTGGYSATNFTGSTTSRPNIPSGTIAFMLKERMFVVDPTTNTVWYSKSTDPTTWAAPDGGFFKVTPGDGDVITSAIVQNNSIVIFKRNSTYVFTFTTDPAYDGVLRPVSTDIGAYSATVFNNEVYTVNNRSVFKFVNLYFSDIGQAINIQYPTGGAPGATYLATLHVVDQTLVLLMPDKYGFAMNLINGAWSRYKFDFDFVNVAKSVTFYDSANGKYTLFQEGYTMKHLRTASNTYDNGPLVAAVRTPVPVRPAYLFKTRSYVQFQLGRYIIGDEAEWKRLYWWALHGTDSYGAGTPTMEVDGNVISITDPVPIGRVVTKSTRFRRINIGYSSPSAQTSDALTTNAGPTFHRATLYFAPKALIEA